jgi:integrase
VFPSKKSKTGHLTTVAKAWRGARDNAGVPKSVVMYSARHTFGTIAMDKTGNPFAVKTAMGHASLQTTDKYQHPGLEQIRAAMEEKNTATLSAAAKRASAQDCHNLPHS